MTINKIAFLSAFMGMMCACTETSVIMAGDYDESKGTAGSGSLEVMPIAPLQNPDRGYHLECTYWADNMQNPFNLSEIYPKGFIDDRMATYESANDGVTLVQQYIYLTKWVESDISQEGLDNIQKIFDGLRSHGCKAILRFAYNYTGLDTSGGESERWILRHIEQLQPLLEKNKGLIATIQSGFLGAWGEWHNSPLANNQAAKNKIMNALLNAYPAPYCIEIRTPDHKNALTFDRESDKMRMGFNNDYFTAGQHPLAPGNDFVPGDNWYQQATAESPSFYMSGEIPYNEQSEWGLSTLIGRIATLKILRDHHYSAFDITQNFELNIYSWKQSSVTADRLKQAKILFDENYFMEDGRKVSRSFYEFVRDHLGYRLNVQNSSELKAENGKLIYNVNLTNTGFATVVNPKLVYLVLLSEAGEVVKELKLDVNPKDWQPFDPALGSYDVLTHTLKGTVDAGVSGKYKVGIWMPEASDALKYEATYAVKFAPSATVTHWQDNDGRYAVNVIGEVTL